MKSVGIVVEYNPLHYGHMHHLRETRTLSQADIVIAVMSGNVVQRGEFSFVDKFTKTAWALEAGIDLVVELPGLYTLQSADLFAKTSVSLLNHLETDALVFGSETGDLTPLLALVKTLDTKAYNELIKSYLDQGRSYVSSSHEALKVLHDDLPDLAPNNILALQYLRAIKQLKAPMKPYAIKRIEADYHDDLIENRRIQSATALRKSHALGQDISSYVPSFVMKNLKKMPGVTDKDYYPYMRYKLMSSSSKTLHDLFGFDEGLENRLLSAAHCETLATFLDETTSARYTHSKIKRTLMHMLFDTHKKDLVSFEPPYVRILGMSEAGQKHLNRIKKDLSIPLITKIKKPKHPLLNRELRISKLYDFISGDSQMEKEFKPVMIR